MICLRHVLTVAVLSSMNCGGIVKVWGSTSGQECKTVGGQKCLFPFKYKSVPHSACTTIDNGGGLWCSTKTDKHGNYIGGYWGYCDIISCSECKTVGRKKCVFPFKYKSVPYSACTTIDNGDRLWCSTKTDKSGNTIPRMWGNCNDSICPGAKCLQPISYLYRGSKNVDETNHVCKEWSQTTYTPAKYPKQGLDGNDCRVPDHSEFFPWCYLEKPYSSKSWGFCDVPPCGEYGGTTISILSYNLYLPLTTNPKTGQFPTHPDFANRVERLPAAIIGLSKRFSVRRPDVILFQECATVYLKQLLQVKLSDGKTLKDYYPYYHSGRGHSAYASRDQILSKYPLVTKGFVGADYPFVTIDVGGKNKPKHINVVSAHLPAGHGQYNPRINAWNEIRKSLIKKNIPKTEPIIIGGDFNAEMFSVLKMQEAVVNYDFTKQDVIDEDGRLFPASWSIKTNWLALLYDYPTYPKQFAETLDYIVTLQSHLQPSLTEKMKVLFLKNDVSWSIHDDGQPPIEQHYLGYKFLINGTWVENPTKTNKFYDDLSDHYPVYQEYVFRLNKSLL